MEGISGGYNVELWLARGEEPAHDTALQQEAWNELRWDPRLEGADVTVEVRDGVATLRGVAPSFLQRRLAERAVSRVRGIRALRSDIAVRLPPAVARPDGALAEEVRHALAWNVAVPPGRLSVVADQGRVTLGGEVEREVDRAAAEEAVEALAGVADLVNRIAVRSAAPSGADLPQRVTAALEHAGLHLHHLAVDADEGCVVLRGEVPSLAERDAAEHAAWMVPGVRALEDQLAIAE